MASTGNEIRSSADSPTQRPSGAEIAQDTSPSQKPSTPHENPPFNFQPVELDDLRSSREESQPTASTFNATSANPGSRGQNMSSTTSIDTTAPFDPQSSIAQSKPTPRNPSPPAANAQASSSPRSTTSPGLPMPPQPAHHQERTLHRTETTPVIGADSDNPHADMEPAEVTSTMLLVTLLLNTGGRHAFKLDDKYLKKRNVTVEDDNPINLSVYTLKELIWRDWRNDWDARPASPTSIRLIHFGKLLEDKSHLREGKFANGDMQHVVHMTIKPQEVIDDEDARIAKGAGRSGEDGERSHGCRCVIL